MPPRSAATLLATLALTGTLLVGCTGAGSPAPTAAAPTASSAPSPAAPPEVACLESGTWVLDNDEDARRYHETMAEHTDQFQSGNGGETTYTFADGELTTAFDSFVKFTRMRLTSQPGVIVEQTQSWIGAAVAPYEATATQVAVGQGDASQVEYTEEVLEDGVPWTAPQDPQERIREALASPDTWVYECTEDTLRLVLAPDGVAPEPLESGYTLVLNRR